MTDSAKFSGALELFDLADQPLCNAAVVSRRATLVLYSGKGW
jgi:hypothetical protein